MQHTEGLRDVEQNLEANSDTAYLLASLTKGFVSRLCGELVDDGTLDWDTPLCHYVPLQIAIDPEGGRRFTLKDALSHATGRAHMDLSRLGVDAETIIEKEDLLHVINHLPFRSDIRTKFHYNNYMYALVGKVIEAVSNDEEERTQTWASQLRARILEPLNMERTATNREDLGNCNLAEGHVVLDDRSLQKQPPTDMSDRTAIGAAGSVWSTVPDMLKWTKSIFEALDASDTDDEDAHFQQIKTILSPRIAIDSSVQESTYAMGWIRALLPSKELGFISNNGQQKRDVLGAESRPRLVLYHNGGQSGYLSACYLFPETRSAIVAMSNTYGLGDAPDWTAHAIAEALFDLQPKRDYVALAKARADVQYQVYDSLMKDYHAHRQSNTAQPPHEEFCGSFKNDGLLMTLDISSDAEHTDNAPPLRLVFNKRTKQHHRLRHFHFDAWGFPPASREEMQLREFIDWRNWEQFVLRFQRDASGNVCSLLWRMQEDIEPISFYRTS
jgi:CubicO group peptidase (beta-lactamase class C family)